MEWSYSIKCKDISQKTAYSHNVLLDHLQLNLTTYFLRDNDWFAYVPP